jgi:dipeptidyl aminopeptidase/acylaminoacyl peptidase
VIVNMLTGQMQRPFRSFDASCLPVWSPDGKWLALLTQSGRRRYSRLTLWSFNSETPCIFEKARVTPRIHFEMMRWTSDSRKIVFPMVPEPEGEPPVVTRVAADEPAVDRFKPDTLAFIDVDSGELSTFCSMAWTLCWRLSPDDQRVAILRYTHRPDKPQNTQTNWRQLVVINLADGTEQLIGEPQGEGWGCSFNWSPDGERIAWLADSPAKILIAEFGDKPRLRESTFPKDTSFGFLPLDSYPPPAPLWENDGSAFYLPGQAKLWRFTSAGVIDETIPLPEGQGFEWLSNSIAAFDFPRVTSIGEKNVAWLSRANEIWKVDLTTRTTELVWKKETDSPRISNYWIERAYDAARETLYTVSTSGSGTIKLHGINLASGEMRVVSTLFEGVGDCEYGSVRSLSWTLPDGTACGGSLLLPVGWKEGDKPAVIMSVYGGDSGKGNLSAANFHNDLIVDRHLLSANGYAVLVPDMPQTDEQPAASLVAAGEAAAHALRDSGLVDSDRIAVMGSSYGGYTVMCLMTGSKLFKAGIAANGVYDLLRNKMSWGWTETGQGRMHTSLWENPTRYLENSPFHALNKLETPVLILQGEADAMTLDGAQALSSALRRLGKQGELLLYHNEGHAPISWSIPAQRDMHQRLLQFLHQHLENQPNKMTA